jgi:thioredoxin reductase
MGEPVLDVIIVRAGPAVLSAALVLGRCRRRVLICDAGHPRNALSQGGLATARGKHSSRDQTGSSLTISVGFLSSRRP